MDICRAVLSHPGYMEGTRISFVVRGGRSGKGPQDF